MARVVMRRSDANFETTSRVPIAGFTMKTTLRPGLVHVLSYRLSGARTTASTSSHDRAAPAGGALVGLIQWACMEAMRPHLGGGEHSVGIDIQVLREEAAAAGLVAHVEVMIEKVEGRRVCFRVKAYDGDRAIGEATHERFVLDRERLHPRTAPHRPRRGRAVRPSRGPRVHDGRRSLG
jgi:fluoroacetyl-CoA thioesterase